MTGAKGDRAARAIGPDLPGRRPPKRTLRAKGLMLSLYRTDAPKLRKLRNRFYKSRRLRNF